MRFLVEEIEQCNNKDLDDQERYWIKELKACEHGYNISLGGLGWRKCDDKKLLKLWNAGYISSKIAKELGVSNSTVNDHLKSNGVTQEEINERFHNYLKLKLSLPAYQYDEEGYYVGEFSSVDEAKETLGIDEIHFGEKVKHTLYGGYQWRRYKTDKIPSVWENRGKTATKRVHQYTKDGEYITTYNSLKEAAQTVCGRNTGILIGSVCRGDRQFAYGYRWSFTKEEHLHPPVPPKHYKKVVRISPGNGEEKVYSTIVEAAKDNNVSPPNIIEVCKGRSMISGGYFWKYYDESNIEIAG